MKRLFLLTITILYGLHTEAQYAQQWGLEFPWNTSLNIVSAKAFDGGYTMAGSFSDTLVLGNSTLYSNGMEDVFLLTMDSKGKITSTFSFGGVGNDTPADIVCNNGKIFLVGNSVMGRNGFVFMHSLSTDSLCEFHMSFPYEGILSLDFINVYENTIIIGGSLKGNLTIDTLSFTSDKTESAFIATLSENGKILSGWMARGTCPNRARALVFEGDGGCVLLLNTGKGQLAFSDTLSLAMENVGSAIARFDSDRNLTWIQKVQGDGFVETTSMAADTTGYTLAVNFTGKVSAGENIFCSDGKMNALLMHYSRDGLVEWTCGIGSNEHCRIMNVDTFGNRVFCTGYYYRNLIVQGDTVCQSENKSSFLMSFDLDGELLWLANADPMNSTAGYRVVCDTNSVLLNGSATKRESAAYVNKYIIDSDRESLGPDTSVFEGHNMVVATLVEKKHDNTGRSSVVFPNPTRSNLYWTSGQENDWALQLFDEKGTVLYKTTVKDTSSGHIDVSHLSQGLYFLLISSTEKNFCHSFTKY